MAVSEAPYDAKGNLIRLPRLVQEADWRPNTPFVAQLRLVGYGQGNSSSWFFWEDGDGHRYPMFFRDALNVIVDGNMEKGWTHEHEWVVKKRGSYYGIHLHRKGSHG